MADHVDGPRSIGDPTADVTDVFAFTSPADTARTVVAANVFPSAGADAMFSNAINYSIVVRRVTVAGLGDAAKFQAADQEIRFTFSFESLVRGKAGTPPIQRGTCTLPGGAKLPLTVNDERGSATHDGLVRVFVGLRSDPFFLAWLPAALKKAPNLLQHDNVLSLVIECDTRRVLDPDQGSLFGVIAETVPQVRPSLIGHDPPRIDWAGRPEQTNMRLNNPAMDGAEDIRDLWNQQTPFAINEELRPLFLRRMTASLENWDMRDGQRDWAPATLAAAANVFLDDFLLFDVTKPISDTSHLEIEKSTVAGKPYQTGGGRTIDANVIDILLSWMVNNDREALQGGATAATKPGLHVFPYLAEPNNEIQNVAERVQLAASPDTVWAAIGAFGGSWHPLIARVHLTGTEIGQLRTIETIDGKQIIERLDAMDAAGRSYRYTSISGIPASTYTGTLTVRADGAGSSVEWHVAFLADGQPDIIVRTIVNTLLKTGLASLKERFGAPK